MLPTGARQASAGSPCRNLDAAKVSARADGWLRACGYYSWDSRLDKSFVLTERGKLQFCWKVFNVTNSVRIEPHSVSVKFDNEGSFGYAGSTLTAKRVMQVALRLQF